MDEWSIISRMSLDAARERVASYENQSEFSVVLLGLPIERASLTIVVPLLMACLFCHIWLHVSRVIVLLNRGDAQMSPHPWIAVYPDKASAWATFFSLHAVPVLASGWCVLGSWSTMPLHSRLMLCVIFFVTLTFTVLLYRDLNWLRVNHHKAAD